MDTLDIDTGEKQRLWRSQAPYYEVPGVLLNNLDYTNPIRSEPSENANAILHT